MLDGCSRMGRQCSKEVERSRKEFASRKCAREESECGNGSLLPTQSLTETHLSRVSLRRNENWKVLSKCPFYCSIHVIDVDVSFVIVRLIIALWDLILWEDRIYVPSFLIKCSSCRKMVQITFVGHDEVFVLCYFQLNMIISFWEELWHSITQNQLKLTHETRSSYW